MVGGGDDRQQRDRRVGERDPGPAPALDANEHQRDQQRPTEVQGRHRRELIGNRLVGVLGVDARAVALQRVDEAVLVHHPRWGEWVEHVDHERDHRDREEPVPEPGIDLPVTEHDPPDEGEARGEVHEHVVVVEELNQAVQPHDHALDAVLAEHVQRALDVDDTTGVGEGRVGVVACQVANLLVGDERNGDDDDLAHGEPAAGG